MKAILGVLQGLALSAFIFLCVTVALAVHTLEKHVSSVTMNVGDTITKVNSTLDRVNGKNGTIDQLDKALRDTRLIVAHSDRLLTQQQKSLVMLNAQVGATVANLNEVLASVKETSNITARSEQDFAEGTVEALKGIPPVLSSANIELQQLTLATEQLNKLVSDPNLVATEANVAGVTKNVEDTTADAKDYMHALLHPTWVQRVWGVTLDIAGHLLDPF